CLTVKNANHNYKALENISGHLFSYQLNKEDQQKVQEMSTSGIHPREILSTLCQNNPNNLVISKPIYNA
ncbi:20595_t:CDS:1, partial [Cetraspora pellucida]